MTTVLHLLNGEQYSGLERLVDHLAGAAPAHGYRLVLALLKPGAMRARMVSRNAEVHEVPMQSRFDLRVAGRIAAIASDAGCGLLHSHTVRSALVARSVQRLTRLPWVHHVHSPALHESQHRFRNLLNFAVEARVLRHADSLVTVAGGLSRYVTRRYRIEHGRVTIAPNGVPDRDSAPGVQKSAAPVILTVGLFRPRKGLEHLVDAAGRLRDARLDFRLQIAGEFVDAGYEAAIRRRVERLGLVDRVEFLGFLENVDEALLACDVFVLPSLYGEGMPMAVLEAMAMGRPVVASDIDGIRELLQDGSGLLVPPAHPRSLAEALSRLIASPALRVELALAGQQRQRRFHSVQVAQQRIFDVYRNLLRPSAS